MNESAVIGGIVWFVLVMGVLYFIFSLMKKTYIDDRIYEGEGDLYQTLIKDIAKKKGIDLVREKAYDDVISKFEFRKRLQDEIIKDFFKDKGS